MHQVRYFLAMARMLNFTRAADACNVTQPALTRAIQKLEEEFDGPLFRRERARTHLTELGKLMLPHLERTYESAQAAKLLAKGLGKAEVAPLALGVAGAVDSPALAQVLGEIGAHLPGFELTITAGSSDELIELALAGALDLLIVEAPDDAPGRIEAWELYRHVYAMLTRRDHRLANKDGVALADTSDEVWIACGGDSAARLTALAAQTGFVPIIRHRADGPAQLRQLILAGLGSALVPPRRGETELVSLRIVDVDAARAVVLAAIAGRRRSVAADAFVRAARARAWESA